MLKINNLKASCEKGCISILSLSGFTSCLLSAQKRVTKQNSSPDIMPVNSWSEHPYKKKEVSDRSHHWYQWSVSTEPASCDWWSATKTLIGKNEWQLIKVTSYKISNNETKTADESSSVLKQLNSKTGRRQGSTHKHQNKYSKTITVQLKNVFTYKRR